MKSVIETIIQYGADHHIKDTNGCIWILTAYERMQVQSLLPSSNNFVAKTL
jgi:hypothetical protein